MKTHQHTQLQAALRNHLDKQHITHFVTLNTNMNMSAATAKTKVQHYLSDIRARIFRRNCQHYEWTAWAFLEFTTAGQPHWHLLVQCPANRQQWFNKAAQRLWTKQARFGTVGVREVSHTPHRVNEYAIKLLNRPDAWDAFVVDSIYPKNEIQLNNPPKMQ